MVSIAAAVDASSPGYGGAPRCEYLGSLRTLQRRMGEWRITHAEQVVGQQMGAIRDQENSQLHSKKPMPAGRQLDG